jgi:hypothetical protein
MTPEQRETILEDLLQANALNFAERTALRKLLDENAQLRATVAEKNTVASLFELLDKTGGGSMYLSGNDEQGNIQTLVIVAKNKNANDLMEAYEREEGAKP